MDTLQNLHKICHSLAFKLVPAGRGGEGGGEGVTPIFFFEKQSNQSKHTHTHTHITTAHVYELLFHLLQCGRRGQYSWVCE